jgi:DNA-binding GntR family transcriptional regulator
VVLTAITGQPAYRQIADDLRQKIADGTYEIGGLLPSTARLMEIYNVSNTAVRAAVRELQGSGVLIGQPGKGVYVAARPAAQTADVGEQLAVLTEEVRALTERVLRLESGGRRR